MIVTSLKKLRVVSLEPKFQHAPEIKDWKWLVRNFKGIKFWKFNNKYASITSDSF